MSADLIATLLIASVLAFALAWLSSVGGVGGGVLMLLVMRMNARVFTLVIEAGMLVAGV